MSIHCDHGQAPRDCEICELQHELDVAEHGRKLLVKRAEKAEAQLADALARVEELETALSKITRKTTTVIGALTDTMWSYSHSQEEMANLARKALVSTHGAADRIRADEREACATIALEQRCERDTCWDLACTTIAAAIRARGEK